MENTSTIHYNEDDDDDDDDNDDNNDNVCTLLFAQRILESLRRRYRCHRLPCLILVDAVNGTLLTDIGRQYVLNDPEATGFPWSPLPSLTTLLATSGGGKLMNGFKETVDVVDALRGKLKGLYVSSHDVRTY